jgi:hypothetical protein
MEVSASNAGLPNSGELAEIAPRVVIARRLADLGGAEKPAANGTLEIAKPMWPNNGVPKSRSATGSGFYAACISFSTGCGGSRLPEDHQRLQRVMMLAPDRDEIGTATSHAAKICVASVCRRVRCVAGDF